VRAGCVTRILRRGGVEELDLLKSGAGLARLMPQRVRAAITAREDPVQVRSEEGVDTATGDLFDFFGGLEHVQVI